MGENIGMQLEKMSVLRNGVNENFEMGIHDGEEV